MFKFDPFINETIKFPSDYYPRLDPVTIIPDWVQYEIEKFARLDPVWPDWDDIFARLDPIWDYFLLDWTQYGVLCCSTGPSLAKLGPVEQICHPRLDIVVILVIYIYIYMLLLFSMLKGLIY